MKQRKPGMVALRFILVILAVAAGFNTCNVFAGGVGHSWNDVRWQGYLTHYKKMDSALALFSYPTNSNFYDTVRLRPPTTDSFMVQNDTIELDSIGLHFVKFIIWEKGGVDSVIDSGHWQHGHPRGGTGAIGSGSSANVCRIYGYTYDLSGTAIEGAIVTATLPRQVNDTCAADSLIIPVYYAEGTSDAAGYWYIDLIYSTCMKNSKYRIRVDYGDGVTRDKPITVPDAVNYRVLW